LEQSDETPHASKTRSENPRAAPPPPLPERRGRRTWRRGPSLGPPKLHGAASASSSSAGSRLGAPTPRAPGRGGGTGVSLGLCWDFRTQCGTRRGPTRSDFAHPGNEITCKPYEKMMCWLDETNAARKEPGRGWGLSLNATSDPIAPKLIIFGTWYRVRFAPTRGGWGA